MDNIGILTAFAFGFLSFISPCVLPIVPGYISFISGVSLLEIEKSSNSKVARRKIILNTLLFVLGFSVVFILLGATATAIGQFLFANLTILSQIAGGIIIIFGLHLAGVFKIKFLNYEKRIHSQLKPLGYLGSFVVGLAFAFGWTPCIGPILGGILALAAQKETVGEGIVLLASYSAGLGIPFLITGFSLSIFYNAFNKIKHHFRKIEIAGGVLLIIVGILMFTGSLMVIANYLTKWFPFLSEIS
ncbi:MAG: cytochrome c biogenesis protein CcdA [Bacteroidota bacterium]|nr:cytochrome c biogenesis protein CcdA [Bacteroidota bacterium]